jgi:DNA-binding winged helix-turn-helix (wHTH) protein
MDLGAAMMVSDHDGSADRGQLGAPRVYEFGDFRLDAARRRLTLRRDGTIVALPARVFDTLLCFVERPGRLLSKTLLLETIWPDVRVEENSLSRNISILRRALGDDSSAGRLIMTEQGRGYRFVAEVRASAAAGAPRQSPTRSDAAHDLVMQARALSVRPSQQNLRGALEILEKAVAREPRFAPAHCMLARVRATFLVFDLPVEGGLASIERDARRALELDASLGDAHAALAWVRAFQGRWIEAEQHFRSAMSLGAQSDAPAVHMTLVTHSVGHFERALSEALELHRLEPTDGFYPVCIAIAHGTLGNDAEAWRYADIARALGQPRDQAPLQDLYAELALRSGRDQEAAQLTTAALSMVMRAAGGEESVQLLFAALTDGGRREEALASLHALETAMGSEGIGHIDTKRLLSWYARLGDIDAAYAIINRCLDRCARVGTIGAAWGLLWRPHLRTFRADPRFSLLSSRMGFPDYWLEYGRPVQ